MNNIVIQTINKYGMLQNGDKVIVALSGGADSVTLLDILSDIKEKYDITLYIAHVNHGIRGEEADRDESFCKALSEKYNAEFFIRHEDIKTLAKQQKISEELCGRNIRYEFFNNLSEKLNAKIATAHTASDNAETLLFNIARGTSVAGVSAIPPVRDNVIRPLIELTRTQIEQYCNEHKLNYVTDSTNLTDDYTRNNIRHNVIPQLSKINPRFEESAMRLSENAREITQYINVQTQNAIQECKTEYGYDCKILLKNDIAVLKNAVVMICKENAQLIPEYRHIELIINKIKNGGAVNLTDKITVVSKQGILRFVIKNNTTDFEEIKLDKSVVFDYNGKQYTASIDNSIEKNRNPVFRTRKCTDTFTYFKRNITKPLRKVLNEQKIPSEVRDNLLLLADGSTVLWCEGVGFSLEGEKYKSNKELKIEWDFS